MPGVFALSGCQGSGEVRREQDAAVGRRVLSAWRERDTRCGIFDHIKGNMYIPHLLESWPFGSSR